MDFEKVLSALGRIWEANMKTWKKFAHVNAKSVDEAAAILLKGKSAAMAGGTDKSLIVDTTKDTGQQLLDTMNKIRQNAQIPCEYTIPKPPDGEKLDFEKVNVGYDDPDKMKHDVYYVEKKDSCDPSKGGGWFYDTPPDSGVPTKILLCPSTCTDVTVKFGFVVNVTLGCGIHRVPA